MKIPSPRVIHPCRFEISTEYALQLEPLSAEMLTDARRVDCCAFAEYWTILPIGSFMRFMFSADHRFATFRLYESL
ncbi:hypothetical protein CY34DRAFT_810107 [Suillus luteus UH-Slu-Lm8-n1]|uniref:Uncharacterized protein n=1 Tax=Suillus luteus UH-Slu-Lm8-n1 TaxID=930992 RepID=A0A0C9ZJP1_9AGAM|nr:hypothetical protein CY34DRAFT_810107 [Suillus luteus UH-Slu-Lm8-n1]